MHGFVVGNDGGAGEVVGAVKVDVAGVAIVNAPADRHVYRVVVGAVGVGLPVQGCPARAGTAIPSLRGTDYLGSSHQVGEQLPNALFGYGKAQACGGIAPVVLALEECGNADDFSGGQQQRPAAVAGVD